MSNVYDKLREQNEEVPIPPTLPSEAEVDATSSDLGIPFPDGLKDYLLKVSDIVFGTLEPVTITNSESHTHLVNVFADALDAGIPAGFVPLCEDNGDYFCVTPEGTVEFWTHDGVTDETWPSIESWIENVWLES